MQHKGVVEALVVAVAALALDVPVFFVDLRGLREAGLLFVHRLGDDDAGIVLVQLQQQRRAVFHHRNELLIAHPGGVEQDVIAQVANLVDHLAGVVDSAVVGAELDDRQAERAGFVGAFRRHFADLLAQVAFVEAVRVDAADKAERVAGGLQIHRRGTGLDQRAVVVGFMVVAIEQHQVAARQQGVGRHLVRGRGAVEHEVGLVGVEHLGGVLLRGARRAFVDQQIAQFDVGVAHVGAEKRFAVEVEELAARRVFAEELAALVAGAGKGGVAHFYVLRQRVEERRQQLALIFGGGGLQLFAVELGILAAQLKHAVQRRQYGVIQLFFAADGDEQRNVQAVLFDARHHTLRDVVYRQHDGSDVIKIAVMHIDDVAFSFKAAEGLGVGGNF